MKVVEGIRLSNKKVIFISHDASRTGAPIVLLHFLKWFKANTDIPFQILLRNGGELEPEFEALAPVSVFNKEIPSKRGLFENISRRLGLQEKVNQVYFSNLKEQFIQENIGLIYSNTITNIEALELLDDLEFPVISHVHELETYISRFFPNLSR